MRVPEHPLTSDDAPLTLPQALARLAAQDAELARLRSLLPEGVA